MAGLLKNSIANISSALTGEGLGGNPLAVVLQYRFVGFAFTLLILSAWFQQYTKTTLYWNMMASMRGNIVYLVTLALGLGFYLPTFYSIGFEANNINVALSYLKPVLYYQLFALIAFRVLEPFQRCVIGYAGNKNGTNKVPICRGVNGWGDYDATTSGTALAASDVGRKRDGAGTKFLDTIIEPMLQVLAATSLVPIDYSSNELQGYSLATNNLARNQGLGYIANISNGRIVESSVTGLNVSTNTSLGLILTNVASNPIFISSILGVIAGLLHRAFNKNTD